METSTRVVSSVSLDYNQLLQQAGARIAEAEINLAEHQRINRYLNDLDFSLLEQSTQLDERQQEALRVVCQLWDVKLISREITSHRKYIGPFIVFFKKSLAPLVTFFMKDFVRDQRNFNAAVTALVAKSLETSQLKEVSSDP